MENMNQVKDQEAAKLGYPNYAVLISKCIQQNKGALLDALINNVILEVAKLHNTSLANALTNIVNLEWEDVSEVYQYRSIAEEGLDNYFSSKG